MKYKLHIENLGDVLTALYEMTKKDFENWLMDKIEQEEIGREFGKEV